MEFRNFLNLKILLFKLVKGINDNKTQLLPHVLHYYNDLKTSSLFLEENEVD